MDEIQEVKMQGMIKRLAKMPRVEAIIFFGSQVRKDARKDSDIDLAVITSKSTRNQELEIIGLGSDIFDISIFHRLPLIIQFHVLKEGRILFCKDQKILQQIKTQVLRFYWDYSTFMNIFYKRVIHV